MKRIALSMIVLACCLSAGASSVRAGGDCDCTLEGLTPGFWKNHLDAWPCSISPYTPVGCVFSCVDPALADKSLLQALGFRGGSTIAGAQEILLRAAVAALLNSETLCYPYSSCEVLAYVNDALCSGDRATILELAALLDLANNLGVD